MSLATDTPEVVNGIDLASLYPLVERLARRVSDRTRGRVAREELWGSGWQGLRGAAERFDPARQASFRTFAGHAVLGAMLDFLRSTDEFGRGLRRELKAEGQAAPLRFDLEARGLDHPELSVPFDADGTGALRETAEDAFKRFRPRERRIAELYFLEALPCAVIAERIGITDGRVAQLLRRIRASLGAVGPLQTRNSRVRVRRAARLEAAAA